MFSIEIYNINKNVRFCVRFSKRIDMAIDP